MTPADAARILAVAAIYDRRTVGELDAQAWADALNDLNPRDCAEAVRTHYRNDDRWIMPSHIRVIVKDHRTTAARDRANTQTLHEIENNRSITTTQQAIDDCKAAFTHALREHPPRDTHHRPDPSDSPGSADPSEPSGGSIKEQTR